MKIPFSSNTWRSLSAITTVLLIIGLVQRFTPFTGVPDDAADFIGFTVLALVAGFITSWKESNGE